MKNLNVFSPVSPYTSYGLVGINLLRRLSKEYDITLFTPGGASVEDEADKEWLMAALERQQNVHRNKASCYLRIWHQFDLQHQIGYGHYTALTIFELNKFNEIERASLLMPNEIVVCSKWAKDIIEEELGIENVSVAPLGVDRDIFKPQPVPSNLKPERPTCIFLNIGKWEHRKGHDKLRDCFSMAFDRNDDVELWMCPYNQFLKKEQVDEWMRHYRISRLADKIKILPRISRSELVDVINASTCGIFPSRAEGWNMCALEMLSCGKPLIITNYSGHTEFVNKDNSMLVEPTKLETANDGVWFKGQGEWMAFDTDQVDQTIAHMRSIYNAFHTVGVPVNNAGIETATKFSWENSVEKLGKF